MSRTTLLTALQKLHQERRRLLRRLSAEHELAVGTVSIVDRKCGNPTCRCAHGNGHPQVQFLFKDDDDGRRRCKLVRKADEKLLLRAGDRYKQFRADLRRLADINSGERKILMSLRDLRAIHYE